MISWQRPFYIADNKTDQVELSQQSPGSIQLVEAQESSVGAIGSIHAKDDAKQPVCGWPSLANVSTMLAVQ